MVLGFCRYCCQVLQQQRLRLKITGIIVIVVFIPWRIQVQQLRFGQTPPLGASIHSLEFGRKFVCRQGAPWIHH